MTKNEFLRRLENELGTLAATVRNDILNEYENHINEGIVSGESEEAVVGTLGDPADIAEEILSVEEKEEAPDYISMQSNIQQDIDPKAVEIIDIQGDFLSVDMRYGTKFEMHYESPDENSEFSHGVNGGRLIIKHKTKNADKVHFNILGFLRNRNHRNDRLTIVWPENLSGLKVRTEKGVVDLDGLTAKDFDINTELGSISCENVVGVKGDFNSEMGSITVKDSLFDEVKFTTDMGRLKTEDMAAKYQSYTTEMGAVDIRKAHPDANINAHTNMGSINVEYKNKPDATEIIATTKMGSVKNALENYVVDHPVYTAKLTTSMGSVSVK